MDPIVELEERLRRYPGDRYPVQRATALFHLGLLLGSVDPPRAASLLSESSELFDRSGLEVEAAKARNALGSTLRELGRLDAAADAFRAAAEVLEARAAERGAALFNLALVLRARHASEAVSLLEEAQEIFAAAGARRAHAAALRELGTAKLEQGEVAEAVAVLESALARADEAADDAALGAAANALGLAYLAAGRERDAVDLLRRAASAHPRSIRPPEHAMAKANLALAYERAGDARRARLAARQALAVSSLPEPVREQARSTLARVGDDVGDLVALLGDEPRDRWPALVREEIVRWADSDDATLAAEARAWAAAQDDDRAEALLGALLELPSEPMERVLDAALAAGGESAREQLERSAALFHAPQELRLRDVIGRLEQRRNSSAT